MSRVKDHRFNSKVRLKEEDGYDSDSDSFDNKHNNTGMEESMRHLRDLRSRDLSQSTTRSGPIGIRTPNPSGTLFSNLPSNAVIQESLRQQYNGSRVGRKNYAKRTKVSVLDSSISSLYKNSLVENQNTEGQNRDPNREHGLVGRSGSSIESNNGHHYNQKLISGDHVVHANTNPIFQFNKYKDIPTGYSGTNLMKNNGY